MQGVHSQTKNDLIEFSSNKEDRLNKTSSQLSKKNYYSRNKKSNLFRNQNLAGLIEGKGYRQKNRVKSLIDHMHLSKHMSKTFHKKSVLSVRDKSYMSRPISPNLNKEEEVYSHFENKSNDSDQIIDDETDQIMRETISNLQDKNHLLLVTKDSSKNLKISKVDCNQSETSIKEKSIDTSNKKKKYSFNHLNK